MIDRPAGVNRLEKRLHIETEGLESDTTRYDMTLPILSNYLVEHFNKGKRVVGRLQKRTENR